MGDNKDSWVIYYLLSGVVKMNSGIATYGGKDTRSVNSKQYKLKSIIRTDKKY
jgi:hypothetical protein